MARRRRQTASWWVRIPIGVVVGALVGWGIWQAALLKRSLMEDVRASTPAVGRSQDAPAAQSPPGTLAPQDAENVPTPATASAANGDPWDAAMSPVALNEPAARGGTGMAATAAAALLASWPAEHVAGSPEELLSRGDDLLKNGQVIEGRATLNAALVALGEDARAPRLREELAALNAGVFLGSAILPDDPAARYVNIQPGDTFLKLSRSYGVPAALLEAMNPGLNPRNLKPLTGVKVIDGPFNLRICKHAGRADLFARNLYVRSFASLVEDGNYLPVGLYRVSAGGKIQVGARRWVGLEGISEETRDVTDGWLYGQAGPRQTGGTRRSRGGDRISGVKMADADLSELYNVLVEARSLLRVEP